MTRLLFLAHRIPYPPDKGDKIRAWHMLRHLAARAEVHLGCLVDDPEDLAHRAVLEGLCASVHLAPLARRPATLRSARALLEGKALSLRYFWDEGLAAWVRERAAIVRPDVALVYSSAIVPYLDQPGVAIPRRILDYCDVDSDKFRAYAARKTPPMSWVYAREARFLGHHEIVFAGRADLVTLATEPEAALMRGRLPPQEQHKVIAVVNGVDTEYFDPALPSFTPFGPGGPVLVFTGTMDYWPNVEAVTWFAAEIWPRLVADRPDLRFAIVGAKPTPEVAALARLPGVLVTGRVPDVRPYLAHAAIAVAPLRIARGIQNKVLEALAMARPVVATEDAAEGLEGAHAEVTVARAPETFVAEIQALLDDPARAAAQGAAGRTLVLARYGWGARLAPLDAALDRFGQTAPARPSRPAAA